MGKHSIRFNINSNLFIRDPQGSKYGQKLLENSILLFDELGFEAFTFKKLAHRIVSTEASIYRYFQNKHVLLLYLTNWYWEWVHYLIDINTRNIDDVAEQFRIVIHNIVNASTESPLTEYINETTLHQIIIREGSKAFHIHDVDDENKEGFFQSYKEVVNKVSDFIFKLAPKFPYPNLLASNLIEMANNQIFFAEHLPRLTDIKNRAKKFKDLEDAMNYMAFKLLAD